MIMHNCSFIILNYNSASLTIKLSKQVSTFDCIQQIIVIDNCSSDDSLNKLQQETIEKVHIYKTESNKGYGAGNNFGIEIARKNYQSDICIIANPDIEVTENTLKEMLKCMDQHDNCAAVTAVQIMNGRLATRNVWDVPSKAYSIFHGLFLTGFLLDRKMDRKIHEQQNSSDRYLECDCLAGSLVMVNSQMFEEVGGYDQSIFLYMEESVLGYKLKKAGYKSYLCNQVEYKHQHSKSISTVYSIVGQRKLLWNSTRHYLQYYCKCNYIEILLARWLFAIGTAELTLKKIIN
jgi:N-acetylglucosaminyl-diphospho-decaprenol L-rhamnosyltransferase